MKKIYHTTVRIETAGRMISGKRGARTGGLRVSGSFNPEPDLDNANVGMISLLYVSCRLGFSAAFCFLIRIWRQIGGTTLCRIKKVMQEGDRK